jgi:ATP-dependent Lon protease
MRAKIHTVIIPERNKKDLEEIPRHIRKKLRFVFARDMDQVLEVALVDGQREEQSAAPRSLPEVRQTQPPAAQA